jgi:hypothetical protein
MLRRAEIAVVAIALVVVVVLAVTDPGSERQRAERHDVEVVRRAARGLEYRTVKDAWMQARFGASAALTAIIEGIDVGYLHTYQDGDAIILTFDSRGACIRLVSRPAGNTVETRHC